MKKYLSYVLLLILIILNIGIYAFLYYIFYYEEKEEETYSINETITNEEVQENDIYVDIKGAVNTPGVYKLKNNSIINDLVLASGGFNSNAYTNNINLSKKLSNEMVVYVYTKYEYSKLDEIKTVYVEKECNCPKYDIKSCIDNGSSIIKTTDDTEKVKEEKEIKEEQDIKEEINSLININTASLEELMTLSGIGEAKAKSIISYRETNGNFIDTKDITKVSGISDNMYEKIKDNITV